MKNKYIAILVIASLFVVLIVYNTVYKNSPSNKSYHEISKKLPKTNNNIEYQKNSRRANALISDPDVGMHSSNKRIDETDYKDIINILTNGSSDIPLNGDMRYVSQVIWELGNISSTNDHVYKFLENAVQPNYWEKNRKWKVNMDDNIVNDRLTRICVRSLGASARPEVILIYNDLMAKTDIKYKVNVCGSFVDAFHISSFINNNGREKYMKMNSSEKIEEYNAWLVTSEGQKWDSWYREIHKEWVKHKMNN